MGQRTKKLKVGCDFAWEFSDETIPVSRTTLEKYIVWGSPRTGPILKSSKMPLSSDTRNASLVLPGHGEDTLKMVLPLSVGSSRMGWVVDLSRRYKSVDVMISLQCGRSPRK